MASKSKKCCKNDWSKAAELSRKQQWLLDRPWFGMPSCVARFRHFMAFQNVSSTWWLWRGSGILLTCGCLDRHFQLLYRNAQMPMGMPMLPPQALRWCSHGSANLTWSISSISFSKIVCIIMKNHVMYVVSDHDMSCQQNLWYLKRWSNPEKMLLKCPIFEVFKEDSTPDIHRWHVLAEVR